MASSHHHSSSSVDRPERSRNAKAQARHRAKRKAYIEQLEQTVAKLQLALGLPSEQLSVLPPPSIRIRELEQENARLEQENEELRQALAGQNGNSADEMPSRSGLTGFASTRDSRRRRGEDYLVPSIDLGGPLDRMTPPSLSIPSSGNLSQQYSPHPLSTHASSASSSGYSLSSVSQNPSPFHHTMPPTPSSGSSSPSFSASSSMAPTRSPILAHPPSGFSSSHYSTSQQIKVEEDAYLVSVPAAPPAPSAHARLSGLKPIFIPVRIVSPVFVLPCG
ncbi:uncharacterized protein SCHCODRAFT_02668417 [Schizophyllum commune H4-8]|nr:uncharacterized protein SCHCODRAFT_02668417 [Schizophyllum commune H4-8]KAI5890982.1 hypothetical protein SCHCODRAFT_02668417 [Schizophyllum commune H4-8]